MKSYINYSVIIPHYNTYIYLKKLIDSIPNRDDIEIIVVDDKSDNIQEYDSLADSYCDRNILFLKNNHNIKSAGTCRNIGLEYAKGKWLLFADSDDYFTNNSFAEMDKFLESDYDLVFFSPTSSNIHTGLLGNRHKQYEQNVLRYIKDSNKQNEFILRTSFWTPWSKMIRRELVISYNIRFDELICSNDVMFSTKSGVKAKKIYASEKNVYCVTEREGSLASNLKKNISVRRDVIGRYFIYIMKHFPIKYFWKMGYKYNIWRYYSLIRLFIKRNIQFIEAIRNSE